MPSVGECVPAEPLSGIRAQGPDGVHPEKSSTPMAAHRLEAPCAIHRRAISTSRRTTMEMSVFPTRPGPVIIRKAMTARSARQTIFWKKAPVEKRVPPAERATAGGRAGLGQASRSRREIQHSVDRLHHGASA